MGFARAFWAAGGAALAGALVFASAPVAAADQVREDQWALKAFDADAIWKISKGKGVTVAVIDAGVDAEHVDLKGNVIDGKNFIDGGSTAPSADDDHGTAMASIIAAHGHGADGADGAMGLAPEAKILNIRDNGGGNDGFAASIRYAVDHGASVINISQQGSRAPNQAAEEDAVAYALQHNALVVAGTGNDGSDNIEYPAINPGVVAVGGVKNNAKIWEKSNFGPEVLLTAPATNIVAAGGKGHTTYRLGNGTSDATAYVSAAAALLYAEFPRLTPGQIANRLVKTAGLPDSAKGISVPDEHYGYGYIQPLAALTRNIPTGSKYGPLTVPQSLKQSSSTASTATAAAAAAAAADDTSSSSSSSNTLKRAVFLTGLGVVALLIVALVIFVVVKIARRNKGGGKGPGGPAGPSGYGPGQPPYSQQPYQQPQGNPHMPPQQGQPPYLNQPQQQPPSSWGNQ